MNPRIVAFDGDDTLWFHEHVFLAAQDQIRDIMAPHAGEAEWAAAFSRIEVENLRYYGYGIKSFILSVVDAATTLAGDKISGRELSRIIEIGKSMLQQDVNVLEGAADVLKRVREGRRLVLITKGDPVEQTYKLDASGLVGLFDVVEIVREKTPDTYRSILAKIAAAPEEFVMVGNTIKSDVLPVLEIGARAIHIAQDLVWEHEIAPAPVGEPRFAQAPDIEAVPDIITQWSNGAARA